MSDQASDQASIDLDKDIFDALITQHEIQRQMCDALEAESDFDKRKALFKRLKLELNAHETAEERHLYIPVMQHDDGLDLSRHAITEHHEIDELIETMEDGRISQETWEETCADLIDKVRHHLKEEENEFFKQARKILDDDLLQRLGALYQVEHDDYEKKHADD